MTLTRIEGFAAVLTCTGCKREAIAGTVPYVSASTEEVREPEQWYVSHGDTYCSECAAKMVEEDPTRSRSRFYTDTEGETIDHKI